MTNSLESITCISIRPPPRQQLFFRLKEIPSVFVEQLDRLYCFLRIVHSKYPSSVAMKILQQVKDLAGEKAFTLDQAVHSVTYIAKEYIRLLEALEKQKDHRYALYSVKIRAIQAIEETDESLQAMDEFREGLADAIIRITTNMLNAKRKWYTKKMVFATENIQAISKFYAAIDEYNGLVQECRDFCEEMMKQASDEDLFKTDPPSRREIQVMQEKWEAFHSLVTDSNDRRRGWSRTRSDIVTTPDWSRPLVFNVVSSQPSPTNESNVSSIWRKIFRHPARNPSHNANSYFG